MCTAGWSRSVSGAFPGNQDGTFLADGTLHLRQHGAEIPLLRSDQIQLRGAHNVMNVLAAFAIGLRGRSSAGCHDFCRKGISRRGPPAGICA